MTVQMVALNKVDYVWPWASDFIESGVKKNPGDLTTADLFTMCRSGHAHLMVGHKDDKVQLAAVWRLETWRDDVVLNCLCLGGHDLTSWLEDAMACARTLAASAKATKLVTHGRRGWGKIIPGAKPIYTAFELEV